MFKFMFPPRKKVKLIAFPYYPEKLIPGIYTRKMPKDISVLDQETIDWLLGAVKAGQVWMREPVEFYLTCDDTLEPNDLCVCEFTRWVGKYKDAVLGKDFMDRYYIYQKIIAEPKEIGLMEVMASDGIDSGDRPSREWPVNIAINLEMLQDILNSDGDCEIEMEEIPDLQTWNEETKKCSNVIVPKLIKNKVIIHPI